MPRKTATGKDRIKPSLAVGRKFQMVTVIANTPEKGWSYVLGRCECGSEKHFFLPNLHKGITKSCGCSRLGRAFVRHGKSNDPTFARTYRTWNAMKNRCYQPKNTNFQYYGGKGVYVCAEWLLSFESFLTDMGVCPPGYSIERKDSDGHYCKDNCIWVPRGKQVENTRRTVRVLVNGEILCGKRACELIGIPYHLFQQRRYRGGYTPQEAFDYYQKQK